MTTLPSDTVDLRAAAPTRRPAAVTPRSDWKRRHAKRTAVVDGAAVRIEVDDNGPGIPVEERENVFRPFYRIDASRNQDSGNTGLGLAIARDIARSHGGDITLGESSMGGLRAIISVPL